jgi:hypothetical protein
MTGAEIEAALVQRAAHFPRGWAQIPLMQPGIGVSIHIADGVVLALHLGQQDLGVTHEHGYHATFGQSLGLRDLDKRAHPQHSSQGAIYISAVTTSRK